MVTLDPGGSSGKHASLAVPDQLAVVFDGTPTLTLSGERIELDRGDSALIQIQAPHQWHNNSRVFAQVLIVSSRHR